MMEMVIGTHLDQVIFKVRFKVFFPHKKMLCFKNTPTRVCMKFIMCCFISFATMALGIGLIIADKFKTQIISTFATNLIILNLTFWLEPPHFLENTPVNN